MAKTVTKTVTHNGSKVHARAVPLADCAGFNAELLVSGPASAEADERAVDLKAWLHPSARKAIEHALRAGREWIDHNASTTRGPR